MIDLNDASFPTPPIRYDLASGQTVRLFRRDEDALERAVGFAGGDTSKLLTWHQSPADPPNLFLRTLGQAQADAATGEAAYASTPVAITRFPDPAPLARSGSSDADARAMPLGPIGRDGLDRYTRRSLRQQEIEIARRFHGGTMWPYAVCAIGGFAIWLSFFPLAIMGQLNLPLAFVVSCFLATAGYATATARARSSTSRC